MISNEVAAAASLLRNLAWRVEHPLESHLVGDYRSIFRGRGMEFDQVVRYQFGDDIRDIDWNVTARLGEPFRKKFIEERELTVLLVFEDSLSLQFGSGRRSKRDALKELAALLFVLAAANRDRIGLIHAQPGGFRLTEPARGRGAIFAAATEFLARPAPALDDTRPVATPWDFLPSAAPMNSVLVLLGDFPPRPAPPGWSLLPQRYQTAGFRVEDPWERELPERKPLTFFDPTASRIVVVDPQSKSHRQAHAAWKTERTAAFARLFPREKDRLVVTPDESMTDALVRFFHAHMRRAAH